MAAPTFCPDCTLCPRLARFLAATAHKFPDYHCKPVAPFGEAAPKLLIVGPRARHARRQSHRPAVHRATTRGSSYMSRCMRSGCRARRRRWIAATGLKLHGVRITNAVKCLPPENKPLPAEIKTCNQYLAAELAQIAFGHDRAGARHGGARCGAHGLRPQAQRREVRARQRTRAARTGAAWSIPTTAAATTRRRAG